MPVDKMPVDKMPVDKMPVDKMPIDKRTYCNFSTYVDDQNISSWRSCLLRSLSYKTFYTGTF
jgi:hypothetical protein